MTMLIITWFLFRLKTQELDASITTILRQEPCPGECLLMTNLAKCTGAVMIVVPVSQWIDRCK